MCKSLKRILEKKEEILRTLKFSQSQHLDDLGRVLWTKIIDITITFPMYF